MKHIISFKKPANLDQIDEQKKSILKKVKSVTRKPPKLEAAAAANKNSILRYALPIQKQNIQNLSLDKETTSVDKEVTPRKLVSDQS